MHVVLAGGGTAGHIEPALNTADALRARDCGISLSVLGTERGLETTLVPARGYSLTLIPAVPLPRRLNSDLLTLPNRLHDAIGQVMGHLESTNADVVVGFGGYVAIPAYFAARRCGIPIVVHEANAKPGLANRIGSRFASAIVDTVAGSLPGATTLGLPLRFAIRSFNKAASRAAALETWALDDSKPTILVFGGSQGARHLNEVVASAAAQLTESGFQILHSVGRNNLDQIVTGIPGYVTVPYIDRMDFAYGIADVAVTRAGAMTVAELTAVGLPALYVPLPIGNGEQRLNARAVVAAGGGDIVDDAQFTSEILIDTMKRWQQQGFAEMGAAAAQCSHRDDVEKFIDIIFAAAKSRKAQS